MPWLVVVAETSVPPAIYVGLFMAEIMAEDYDKDAERSIAVVSRRTTEDAIGGLAEANARNGFAAWYEPGKDFWYAETNPRVFPICST